MIVAPAGAVNVQPAWRAAGRVGCGSDEVLAVEGARIAAADRADRGAAALVARAQTAGSVLTGCHAPELVAGLQALTV